MLKSDAEKILLSVHRALIEERDARIAQLEELVRELRRKPKAMKKKEV